ncbi:MAG: hypothetical protein KGL48_09860 [Sphingomonadales bacterium]|nr:hypothetical protein [Sphingomonadales bacterium]MDE2570099.1 hypothetical protein [Sphingomonadales bacterium]
MSPWLQLTALLMALLIVVGGFRMQRVRFETRAWMVVVWMAIIVVAVLIFRRLGW